MPYALGLLGLAILAAALTRRVSPYIDTSFQLGISRAPSLEQFLERVVADNQAPGVQFLFWLFAQLGLRSIDQQRLASLVVASLLIVVATLMGARWRLRDDGSLLVRTFRDRQILLVASITVAVAAGVFTISTFARYSSVVAPIWVVAFLLTARAVGGERSLVFPVGLLLGFAALLAYSALVPTVCVVIVLLMVGSTRSVHLLARFGLGLALGLIPVVLWLLYAGADHIGNVLARVDVASAPTSVRSIIGRAYELAAWVFVGPASLPSFTGLIVVALAAAVFLALMMVAIVRCGMPVLVLVVFVLLPIPLLFLTRTTSGWAMVGPAAIATMVASFGASRAWPHAAPVPGLVLAGCLGGRGLPRPQRFGLEAGGVLEPGKRRC
jgi:hypothetical protein